MLLYIASNTLLHLIQCEETISNRLCCHRIDRRIDTLHLIRHTQRVELAGNFLVHQFLSESLHTSNLSLCVRFFLDAVKVQFTMNAHIDGDGFDR